VREGADAVCESGCEGGAGWGEVVEDYLWVFAIGVSWVSLTR
jgi:hypothetical protein